MDADFKDAQIGSSTFSGCGLQDVRFDGANLQQDPAASATFENSILDNVSFKDASLRNISFAGSELRGPESAANGGAFAPLFDGATLNPVSFADTQLENVSFAGLDMSNVSLDGAVLSNVDFTGASGLQLVDWSKVTVEGNVYGLHNYEPLIGEPGNPDFFRRYTIDGKVPGIDPATGFDIEPGTGFLIDPDTGVRTQSDGEGGLVPIDPQTGEVYQDPDLGGDLSYVDGRLLSADGIHEFTVDYETGLISGDAP